MLALRAQDGRLLWQTPLARRLLHEYFDATVEVAPVPVLEWVRRQAEWHQAGRACTPLAIARGAKRLSFVLHESTGEDEWLVVMREASDAAIVEAMTHAFGLTVREAEVLYWVVKGKTNRDIGDILGTSPATVKKHLEHVFEKLGVETRTAAAGVAVNRVRLLAPG
jgi:DNA-binding CsgD family transcriptional regulator